MMQPKQKRYQTAIAKEWKLLKRQEEALRRAAQKERMPKWKSALTDKVPKAVFDNLQKAFGKAFWVVFEKGTGIIEKTYDRDSIQEDCQVREFAFQVKASRKTLKKAQKDAGAGNLRNLAITSAEGIGLGILGIGLPDIPLFAGVILKSVYEIAVNYGFSYEEEEEQVFLLKVIGAAVSDRGTCMKINGELDEWIAGERRFSETAEEQADICAEALSRRLLYMKFIQGIPLAGALGGMSDAVCLKEILAFADLKYQKRFLLKRRKT